jgi:DNA polymerase III sliding clamp (beta) subunit (PCNA family)
MTASTIAPPATPVSTDIAFTVEPDVFATATEQVARRIPRRPSVPTLGGLLLEVADGTLTVSAFDYDVAASARVEVVGDAEGRAVVSGRLLAELVKTFPDKPVVARIDGTRLAVTCGAVKVKLPLMPADEYPALPDAPPTVGTVDAEVLAAAVTRMFAAAGGPVTVGLHVGDNGGSIGLVGPSGSVVARLLADRYPDLPGLFPARVDQPTAVAVDALAAALKRAQLVHQPKSPVRLAFTAEQVELTAADGDTALGDAVDCQHHGDAVTVGVNPDYLLDALATLRADVAEFHITDAKKKFLLTAPGDHTYRHLIMPIRPGN